MFLDFYHLREQPFGVTPDPAYLYPSRTHCEALDSLTEGILGDRGFLALIAEPGMGKTTLLNQVLEGVRDTARAAYLFQTQCNSREFFQYLLSELGVDSTGMGLVAMHNKLNELLFAEMLAGKRFVLIVDEAQNLDDTVLETIRLLSNFETSNTKLLQIVLAGQPQLGEKLQQKQLAQLLQRITVVKHLEALSPEETAGYIRHRLKVAGHCGEALFEPEALALVADRSQGIPRIINKICYHALTEAYLEGCNKVSPDTVAKANRKLALAAPPRPMPRAVPLPEPVELEPVSTVPGRMSVDPGTPRLTYKSLRERGSRGWVLGAVVFVAVLLVGGMVVPTKILRAMLHTVRDHIAATNGQAQRKETDEGRWTPDFSGSVKNAEPLGAKLGAQGVPAIAAIQASSQKPFPISSSVSATHESQLSLMRELGLKINRIAIDPGHGGYDTGTMGPHGLLEKNLCLDVALRLGQLIDENIAGAEVVYTRNDDRHVSLEERTAIANSANADLFISIHANSSDAREARGAETYYLSLATSRKSMELATRENAPAQSSLRDLPELIKEITRNDKIMESRLLAVDIQNELSERLQLVSRRERNRGVKQAPFIVLTGAHMPAVLSEISFVSNTSDESLLFESGQRQRVAEGLYRGIAAYLDSLHSLPRKEQKLVSENRPGTSSGYTISTAATGRNHP
jgi:N-acetylmuramoyl-L-alanine amidase/type II secretory pathway predicted ATPase ExeA